MESVGGRGYMRELVPSPNPRIGGKAPRKTVGAVDGHRANQQFYGLEYLYGR